MSFNNHQHCHAYYYHDGYYYDYHHHAKPGLHEEASKASITVRAFQRNATQTYSRHSSNGAGLPQMTICRIGFTVYSHENADDRRLRVSMRHRCNG